jgi:hypothetical protein
MRRLTFALMSLGIVATAAGAQDAIPDLKGTWSGKGKAIVFGNNAHHPGSQTTADSPRVREIEATYVVEGQDGRVAWGRSSSAVAKTQEPFAWAIAGDNKTILGADMDGADAGVSEADSLVGEEINEGSRPQMLAWRVERRSPVGAG